MAQLHEINRAPDRKTSLTRSWVLDTGVTEHGSPSLGVSGKDVINNSVGRVSGGNEQGREHKMYPLTMRTRGSAIAEP